MPMMRTPLISFGSSCSGTPGGGRHAQIDDDDGVVERRVGELEHRFADVLEQLAGDQRLGIERHVADGAARAVEMRREGQSIDAAGRAGQHRRGAAHAQPDAQRAERRTHALRLIVRAGRIVRGVLRQRLALAGRRRRPAHLILAAVAAQPVGLAWPPRSMIGVALMGQTVVVDDLEGGFFDERRCRTCPHGTRAPARRCGRPLRS